MALLKDGPCEHHHPSRVDGKDLEGRRRTSKYVLSRRIEPGASPQLVFTYLRLLSPKKAQWACGGVEDIGSVTSSKALSAN